MLRHLLTAAATRTQPLVCGQDSAGIPEPGQGKYIFTNCLKKKKLSLPFLAMQLEASSVLPGITRLRGSDAGGG